MGINIYNMGGDFHVRKCNFAEALAAIQRLAGGETVTKQQFPGMHGDNHYAFVDTKNFLNATTFADAMIAWRWTPDEDADGDVCELHFAGERLGDEEILFTAIAPFVEPGSYIQVFSHDDGAIWRWVFSGIAVRREYAQIVFSYEGSGKVS